MTVSQKIKYRITVCSSNPACGYRAKGIENGVSTIAGCKGSKLTDLTRPTEDLKPLANRPIGRETNQ